MLPCSCLGKVHCLGRERVLVHIKAKMHFNISTILSKMGRVGKSLFTLKMVPCYTRFPPFSNRQVIYMPSVVTHCFKNLLYVTACQTVHCCVTAQQLRYIGSHEENEQFVKHFLILQQERSNQKVGLVASPPVTMAAQHHFLKDCCFSCLYFPKVCAQKFFMLSVCLRLIFKE